MVLSNPNEEILDRKESIQVNADAEILTCKRCGSQYVSRGKYDPGYCKECEKLFGNEDSIFVGGPLNGQKVGDLIDDA